MKNPTAETIDKFRNKACSWQGQRVANQLLKELKELLTKEEYTQLSIAYDHYVLGEGASETYDVCKELIIKYRA